VTAPPTAHAFIRGQLSVLATDQARIDKLRPELCQALGPEHVRSLDDSFERELERARQKMGVA